MSFSSMTPRSWRSSVDTASGVPPARAIRSTIGVSSGAACSSPGPRRRSRRPRPCGSRVPSQVDAAHAGLRRERDELRVRLEQLALADAVPLLRQHDDRPALGRLVGERRELRGLGQLPLVDAGRREERDRLAVAERDRAGLVEQQRRRRRRPPRPPDRSSRARCAAPAGPCRRCRSPTAARRSSSGSGRRAARSAPRRSRGCPRRSRTAAAATHTIRKMIVNFASRIDSAISFGVFCRSAPSTSAIMRSRNDSPGLGRDADLDPVGQHLRARR